MSLLQKLTQRFAQRSLVRAGAWLSAGILLGRIAGFVRDGAVAAKFGAGQTADIAVILLTLPDLAVNLLTGGALALVLVPEFTRATYSRGSKSGALGVFAWSTLVFTGTGILIALTLFLLSDQVVHLLAPGFSADAHAAARDLVRVAIWGVPLAIASGVLGAFWQSRSRFALPSLQNLAFNSVIVLVVLAFTSDRPLFAIALGVIVACLVRVALQFPGLSKALDLGKVRVTLEPLSKGWGLRYAQAFAGGSLLLLLPVLARRFASFEGEGAFAILNYSLKIVDFPVTCALAVLGAVLLPRLSELFTSGRVSDARALTAKATIFLLASGALMAAFFAGVTWSLSTHVGGWKSLTQEQVVSILRLSALGMIAVPAAGIVTMTTSVYGSAQDLRTPMYLSAAAIALFIPLGSWAARAHGLSGVMVAYVAIYYFLGFGHLAFLRRVFLGYRSGEAGALPGALPGEFPGEFQ